MKKNRFCDLLGIRYPLIQGGMVWVSDRQLASACSQAGILGTLGTGSMSPDEVKTNIEKMFESTTEPFAVNIAGLRPDADDIARLALDMGVRIFITSAGNPDNIIPELKKTKNTVCMHVVPSVRGALKAEKAGADAVICEGYEAGGHNSPDEVSTMALTPQVADAVTVPVAAAGGMADGRGIAAAMVLGAEAVQMGTRFIAVKECPAHINHKQMILNALDTGTCTIGRILGPLRVVKNPFSHQMLEAEKKGADKKTLLNLIGDEYNRNRAASIEGDMTEGAFQAGQSSGLINDIPSVKDLVRRLIKEYRSALKNPPDL